MKVKWIESERDIPERGTVKKGDILEVNTKFGNQLITQKYAVEIKEKKEPEKRSKK